MKVLIVTDGTPLAAPIQIALSEQQIASVEPGLQAVRSVPDVSIVDASDKGVLTAPVRLLETLRPSLVMVAGGAVFEGSALLRHARRQRIPSIAILGEEASSGAPVHSDWVLVTSVAAHAQALALGVPRSQVLHLRAGDRLASALSKVIVLGVSRKTRAGASPIASWLARRLARSVERRAAAHRPVVRVAGEARRPRARKPKRRPFVRRLSDRLRALEPGADRTILRPLRRLRRVAKEAFEDAYDAFRKLPRIVSRRAVWIRDKRVPRTYRALVRGASSWRRTVQHTVRPARATRRLAKAARRAAANVVGRGSCRQPEAQRTDAPTGKPPRTALVSERPGAPEANDTAVHDRR